MLRVAGQAGAATRLERGMRILIWGINYAPEYTGIGKYTGEMAEWLAVQGFEVRVVTAPPHYPAWRVDKGYRGWTYRIETRQGVRVWRCPVWVPAQPTACKRLWYYASFLLSSLPVVFLQWFWRPHVVMTIEPPFFCSSPAWLFGLFSRAKTWLHIQDFEIDAAFGLNLLTSPWMRLGVLKMESWIMRCFDRVSTISPGMMRRLWGKRVPKEKCFLFPNWVNTTKTSPNPLLGQTYRRRRGITDDTFVALYAGNMGRKQGLEIVLRAAQILVPDKRVLFWLSGAGSVRSTLESKAKEKELGNVQFLPLMAEEEFLAVLAAADLHLVIQKKGVDGAVMPSKLGPIFSMGGRALLTTDETSELWQLVSEHPGLALCSEPENPEALARAIAEAASVGTRNHPNETARQYAEKFLATDRVLGNFRDELLNLVNDKAKR